MVTQTKYMTESGRETVPYQGWASNTLANVNYGVNNGKSFVSILNTGNSQSYAASGYWSGNFWRWWNNIAPLKSVISKVDWLSAVSATTTLVDCSTLTYTNAESSNNLAAASYV